MSIQTVYHNDNTCHEGILTLYKRRRFLMGEKPKYQPPEKESEDFRVYTKREEEPYYNKKDHRERTLANEEAEGRKGGHRVFWKKQEKNKEKEKTS